MNVVRTVVLGALSGTMLAGSVVMASAEVVCSGDTCWHTHERYTYPKDSGVVIHEDHWRAGPSVKFREHEGRGYWRGDQWETFPGD